MSYLDDGFIRFTASLSDVEAVDGLGVQHGTLVRDLCRELVIAREREKVVRAFIETFTAGKS